MLLLLNLLWQHHVPKTELQVTAKQIPMSNIVKGPAAALFHERYIGKRKDVVRRIVDIPSPPETLPRISKLKFHTLEDCNGMLRLRPIYELTSVCIVQWTHGYIVILSVDRTTLASFSNPICSSIGKSGPKPHAPSLFPANAAIQNAHMAFPLVLLS